MAKWLDKYEQGGLVLKKKTKDNYGKKPNVNDVKVSAGPGFEGDGYTAQNWKSPAWGGQFAMGGALPGAVGFTYARTAGSAPANGKYTKKTKASAQLGIGLIPYVTSAAAKLAASIPTMEEVKGKAIDVIKNSPKLRSALNSGLSYVANTDWGKEKLKNLAKNVYPRGYTDMDGTSPINKFYSAAILNKKEKQREELDRDLTIPGKTFPTDSVRVDLLNRYAGLPQKYNTLTPSVYVPTMGNKNEKYFSSPQVERELMEQFDRLSDNDIKKKGFKTKKDLENFIVKQFAAKQEDPTHPGDFDYYTPMKGKGNNYVGSIPGLGRATFGIGEDEKGHYMSYYDDWDLNPYFGEYSPENQGVTLNSSDQLGKVLLGNEKENVATKHIGNPTKMYGRIYFDKKTGKPKMQNGGEMNFYQNGLDFKPKSISKNGSVIKDDRGQWAHPGEVTEIDSNDITMQGVDYPVLGISDTGDTKMMQPGEDYKFDGEKVTEFPMMEKGGWLDKFDDKAQEGKDIPKGYTLPTVTVTSRRFNKYPHISNDNILSSKQLAREFTKRAQGEAEIAKRKELANRETVRSYDPEKEDESLLSRAYHIAVNPMTALSYKVKGKDIPDHFERSPDRNILEYATNVINPFSLVDAAASIPGNIKRGEFLQAALNTASILPALSEFRGASYKNIYKYSPYAEKLTGKTRRQIFGDPAYESFLKHGPTTQPERPVASQQAQWLKFNREASPVYNTGTGETMEVAGTTRFDNSGMRIEADYPYAYFSEGSPWYGPKGSARMAEDLGVERIIVPKEGANLELYPAGESSIIMNPKELTKETINSYAGIRRVLSPFGEAFNSEAFDVYKGKPHWWKGYQKEAPPINKNKIAGSVIEGDRKIFYNELGDEVGSIESFPDIDAQRNINWGSANEKMPEPKTIPNPDYTDVGNKYLQNNDPFAAKRSTLKDIPISGGSTTKGPKEQMGFPNPLDFIDEITPRLDPIKLLGVQGDIMDLSPLNLIPGYGKKLAGKNQTFRKFGNSIQDVIERQALSPKGGSKFRMGKDQIVKEGNWAARGEPNENYSGVFEATFDLNNPAANLSASGSANRNGVLMMDKAGNRLPDIPLTEPGMSFNRRLPFSTRYVPIDKQKLINNEFQFATMAPRLQSLAEKYGLGLGAATLMGTGAVDTYNKYTIDPVINMAKKLELEKLGLNFKASKDTSSKKKQNGGWLNKYK